MRIVLWCLPDKLRLIFVTGLSGRKHVDEELQRDAAEGDFILGGGEILYLQGHGVPTISVGSRGLELQGTVILDEHKPNNRFMATQKNLYLAKGERSLESATGRCYCGIMRQW